MSSATRTQALDLIEAKFVTPDSASAREFLSDRPDIADVLLSARAEIPRYFGEGTPVTLRIQDDPDDNRRYIAAYIQTSLETGEAFDRLHQLITDWWLDASGGLREDVLLSLDLV
jgi:hypothetical protein